MALTKVTGQVILPTTDLTVGVLTVTNSVSVGGTLTYEDVTNVDSVGLITARNGINVIGAGVTIRAGGLNVTTGVSTFSGNVKVGSGITLSPDGDVYTTGVSTFTSTLDANGNVELGTNASNTVTFNADVASALIPNADNTRALGANGARWSKLWVNEIDANGDVSIADAIVHTGDNSKIRFPSTDTITAETAGTERIRIDSSGELLIGATARGREKGLHLAGAYQDPTGVWTQMGIYSTDSQAADKGGSIGFGGQDGSTAKQQFSAIKGAKENATSANYAGYLAFYTRPAGAVTAERLRITSAGLVGIGIAAPEEELHIHASGSSYIKFTDESSGTGGSNGAIFGLDNPHLYAWNYEAGNFVVATSGTERLRITGDGPHLLLGGTADVNEITESSSNTGMVIGSTSVGNGGLAIINSTSGTGRIYFGDATGSDAARNRGQINYYHSGDYMMFATAASERVRIHNDGKISINTTSTFDSNFINFAATKALSVNIVQNQVAIMDNQAYSVTDNGGGIGFQAKYNNGGSSTQMACIEGVKQNNTDGNYEGAFKISTRDHNGNMYERIRIRGGSYNGFDMAGRTFSMGTFSTTGASVGMDSNPWSNNEIGIRMSHQVGGGQTLFAFYNTNGQVGYIQTSGSGTIYNTGSDYRLKENQVLISDGITRLKQLKPYRFNFKKDPSTTLDGFFAHEVQTVVPEAISGTKDQVATKDEGDRKTGDVMLQGMDYGRITPLLTAALQEAIAEIETLKTKVAALESA